MRAVQTWVCATHGEDGSVSLSLASTTSSPAPPTAVGRVWVREGDDENDDENDHGSDDGDGGLAALRATRWRMHVKGRGDVRDPARVIDAVLDATSLRQHYRVDPSTGLVSHLDDDAASSDPPFASLALFLAHALEHYDVDIDEELRCDPQRFAPSVLSLPDACFDAREGGGEDVATTA